MALETFQAITVNIFLHRLDFCNILGDHVENLLRTHLNLLRNLLELKDFVELVEHLYPMHQAVQQAYLNKLNCFSTRSSSPQASDSLRISSPRHGIDKINNVPCNLTSSFERYISNQNNIHEHIP